MGVVTGTGTSGVLMDKMSKEGPTSGERKGEVTLLSCIRYSSPIGGARRIGLNIQSLVCLQEGEMMVVLLR